MTAAALRIDKWLWHARFFKTRSLAAKIVAGGVRVNGVRVTKPAATVKPEDTLTFAKDDHIRVIRIIALGERRGPAPEAQALYEDLDPPERRSREAEPMKEPRPDRRDRRAAISLKTGDR